MHQSVTAPNWFTQSAGYTLKHNVGRVLRHYQQRIHILQHQQRWRVHCRQQWQRNSWTLSRLLFDARLKENVETLDGSKVYEMRGVSFTKDGREGSGVIAQELKEVAPELVHLRTANTCQFGLRQPSCRLPDRGGKGAEGGG